MNAISMPTQPGQSRGANITLWVIQILFAALFMFAGVSKFLMPIADMTKQTGMPAAFLYFIGVAEVLGGLGLVLPMRLRIMPKLTPIAAGLLAIIMAGAVVMSVRSGPPATAILPAIIGVLLVVIAVTRWRSLS